MSASWAFTIRVKNCAVPDLLAREVKNHERIFVALTPSPGFRDVVGVLEAHDQAMMMSLGRIFEVSRALKFKAELLGVVRVGSSAHAGRICPGATMHTGHCSRSTPTA